jgi:hypothetical protein
LEPENKILLALLKQDLVIKDDLAAAIIAVLKGENILILSPHHTQPHTKHTHSSIVLNEIHLLENSHLFRE